MSPQLENGYTRLSNELLDALCSIRIPGEARQIFDFIMRKTYGFNKKEDQIALSQFCNSTLLDRPNVCRAIRHLLSMNLITRRDTDAGTVYAVNKDYASWTPSVKNDTVSKTTTIIVESDNEVVSKTTHTKDTITKDKKHIATTKVAAESTSKKKEKKPDDSEEPMTLQQFMKWLLDSPRRDHHIIANYADERKPDNRTKGQWRVFLTRNLRPAKSLVPYSDGQIAAAMKKLRRDLQDKNFKWTLETIIKYLD